MCLNWWMLILPQSRHQEWTWRSWACMISQCKYLEQTSLGTWWLCPTQYTKLIPSCRVFLSPTWPARVRCYLPRNVLSLSIPQEILKIKSGFHSFVWIFINLEIWCPDLVRSSNLASKCKLEIQFVCPPLDAGGEGDPPLIDVGLIQGYMTFSGQGAGLVKNTLGYNLPSKISDYPNGLITVQPYLFGLSRWVPKWNVCC